MTQVSFVRGKEEEEEEEEEEEGGGTTSRGTNQALYAASRLGHECN